MDHDPLFKGNISPCLLWNKDKKLTLAETICAYILGRVCYVIKGACLIYLPFHLFAYRGKLLQSSKSILPQKIPCGGCKCKNLMYNFLSNLQKYIFNLVLFLSSLQVCQRELSQSKTLSMNWFPLGVVWLKCKYLPSGVIGISVVNAPNNNYNIFVYGKFL